MHGTWFEARCSALTDRLLHAILLAFFATAVLGSGTLRAQQGVVVGTVIDGESFAPVSGAQVFDADATTGTLSNREGGYRLEGLTAGAATITVRLIGYREVSQTVAVVAGQVTTADFSLEQTALKLQEIVVTGLVGETSRVKLPFPDQRDCREDAGGF